jgi:peptidoglycan/LPS O-acetylase OafA/YrhL
MTVRNNNFSLVRLFGAVLVVYGHSYALTGNPPPGFAGTSVSTIGVKIFFSISGYLVSRSWLSDPNVVRFFSRRALRIFPALVCVVLTTVFIIGPSLTRLPLSEYFLNSETYRYIDNIFLYIIYFLPGLFQANTYPNAVNGSLWSLPAEFLMYIITPMILVGVTVARRGRVISLALLLVAIALLAGQTEQSTRPWVVYATNVWAVVSLAPYFIVGLAVAAARLERLFNIYVSFALLFILAVFQTNAVIEETMLIFILPYVTLSFASGQNLAPKLGDLDVSYGVFLWGFLIQQVLAHFIPGLTPWQMFAMAFPLSLIPAFYSWNIVEKPALRAKPAPRAKFPDSVKAVGGIANVAR